MHPTHHRRLPMKLRSLVFTTALLLCGAPRAGHALSARQLEYLVELGQAVAIPMGGDGYTNLADPSYDAQLRFTLGIPVMRKLLLGPFLQLHGSPINSDDSRFEDLGFDARFGRLRFMVGLDVRYRFIDRIDVFVRFGVGADYAKGSVRVKALGNLSGDYSSTVFGFEPALGAEATVWRELVLGVELAFPIAINHSFGGGSPFNAADARLGVIGGWRF